MLSRVIGNPGMIDAARRPAAMQAAGGAGALNRPAFGQGMHQTALSPSEAAARPDRHSHPVKELEANSPVLQYRSPANLEAADGENKADRPMTQRERMKQFFKRAEQEAPVPGEAKKNELNNLIQLADATRDLFNQVQNLIDAALIQARLNEHDNAHHRIQGGITGINQAKGQLPAFISGNTTTHAGSYVAQFNQLVSAQRQQYDNMIGLLSRSRITIDGIQPTDAELLQTIGKDREGRSPIEHQQHTLAEKPLSATPTTDILSRQDALNPRSNSPGELEHVLAELSRRQGGRPVMT